MNLTVRENNQKTDAPFSYEKNGADDVFYPESDGNPMAETEIHIRTIIDLYESLRLFFSEMPDIKIFSDIMFYYEEGDSRKFIAPDVMVVRGIDKSPRRVFKLWEEKTPDVVFEISSRGTWREDLQKKYFLYEKIGVKEYYIFDPEYDYLKDEFLVAYRFDEDNKYEEIKIENNRIFSPALGLEIVNTGETLRLYNPETEGFLPTNEELVSELRQKNEEIEKLKAELAKLKA